MIPNEVSQLLDISPDPTLLVSNQDLEILASNASMAELTGYTRKELLNLHLDTLLPNLLPITQDPALNLELHSIQGRKLDLITRRKQKIPTQVQGKTLGKTKRFTVYRLNPHGKSKKHHLSPAQEIDQFEGILALSEIFYQPSLDQALEIIIQVGKGMLTAESLGIYKIDSNHPQLKAVVLDNPSGYLPSTISTADFFSHYKDTQFSHLNRLCLP